MSPSARRHSHGSGLLNAIAQQAHSLEVITDLDPLIEHIGDAQFVLIGEASHGTHEYYQWRALLTMRLIAEKGFAFVAVEGDWPDCYEVNRFVKGHGGDTTSAVEALGTFQRWPSWMWANREVAAFAEWMREHNRSRPENERVGFYGLDVYSLWDSMREVVSFLERVDPAAAREARRAYGCFEPYHGDEQAYARATAMVPTSCEEEAIAMLRTVRERAREYAGDEGRDALFNAEQNALVAANAERYYRTMVRGGSASWNVRDRHMVETLERLVEHHGDGARAIVWEHNTHLGDARYTDMRRSGVVNVGQLVREAHGEGPRDRDGVAIVGFGSHHGTVLAGEEWGAPARRMLVPEAPARSWEALLNAAGMGRDLLMLFDGSEDGGIPGLEGWLEHRAIGVVYDPTMERYGNWVPSQIPRRYDAFLYIDETRALDALHPDDAGVLVEPETYPSGT